MKKKLTKVSEGCYFIFNLAGFTLGLFGAGVFFFLTPFSSLSLVDLWVLVTTLALPVVYMIGFMFGQKQMKTTTPDPTFDIAYYYAKWIPDSFQDKLITLVGSLAIVAVIFAIPIFAISHSLEGLSETFRVFWAISSTSGLMILSFLGYWLGNYPMEDQRKRGLAFLWWIWLLLLGGFVAKPLYEPQISSNFWLGIALGIISGILSIIYLSYTWNPSKLSSTSTHLDSGIGLLAIVVGFALIFLFFDEEIISGCLGPWVLLALGYLIIQSWRHRPS